MLANRNKGTRLFTKDTSKFSEFKKYTDLELNKPYKVYGFYLNTKSQFGEHYTAIGEDFYINLPKSMNEIIAGIINDCKTDEELLNSINSGNESIIVKMVFSKKMNKEIHIVDFAE